ncbi:Helicase SKI2W [Fasciola gigantica]|uniref:Helicase SKI2W n=1 Tax=Fasciola gigantica TaxID=46835 RepID=A0A504YFA8_FASGI|nr:Helicase SKI2W [Fasciola gigantica]
MAGRAGRRGLDASGTVIILVEGVGQSVASIKTGIPSQETLTGMILGKPTQLTSQFKITYSMILHLHRTNWLSPQDIMRRSFMEAPALRREIKRRQYLTQLRNLLLDSTFLIPSAGSSTSAVGTTSAQAWTEKTGILPTSPVSTGEPILQVKCPFGQTQCVQTMATYYQQDIYAIRSDEYSTTMVVKARYLSRESAIADCREMPRGSSSERVITGASPQFVLIDIQKSSIQCDWVS